ncbi:hypothetical protein H4R20_003733 [Coemansia guatemalensis]|uniref:NAD-dependent epimerase/dehydratase domain-containing protein n=1 Tax=Coemansia guatemalensis TaxID=2761395 RepID=A0A9W8LSQ6_9FUNG|nr:hypothetical protein H4R20_003733 [Coemansia guatemalensis]
MANARRIFVVGGSGFVGRAICNTALARGWEVLSLSRHGAPNRSTIAQSNASANLAKDVQWIKGDALRPETFRDSLAGCDAVVHSVGVLMENGYKALVNIGNRGGSSRSSAATYESANRDTALCVAHVARETPGVKAFAYISASDAVPFLDPRYISTKREVERELLAHREQLRPILLRPGFMFSPDRPLTIPMAAGVEAFRTLFHRTPVGCVLKNTPFAKAATPALRRELVAEAIINAIANPQVSGILEIADIERIGKLHQ